MGGIFGGVFDDDEVHIDELTEALRRVRAGEIPGEPADEAESMTEFYRELDGLATDLEQARADAAEATREREAVERTARTYGDTMAAMSDGDLTRRLDETVENEGLGDLATEFNALMAEFETAVISLKKFAGEVATYSREVSASTDTVQTGGEHVSDSLSDIAGATEAQSASLQSVAAEMNSLSTTIEEITATANEVAETAERTAETGNEGRAAAAAATESMRNIEAETEETVAAMASLESEVAAVDDLVDTIAEVAQRTNVLALNANIEASRNGDSEGFGAVASEIKDLSETTQEAAANAEERLDRIAAETGRSVEQIEQTQAVVSEDVADVERAIEALDDVADYAQRTNEGVQEITTATEQQADSTQEVVTLVERVTESATGATEESEAASFRAAANANALGHVSDSAGRLTTQSRQLLARLQQFDTSRGYDLPEARVTEPNTAEQISAGQADPKASD
ncbi:methyl-accepting chemotaxis protein [Haloarchaeobius amylolyticus]|uniref:methyl-accepting chemotaxis protein n=1 Tax=Haloarchaeobius amylolyticus TaxID=1198296 RepID=UPI00226F0875|nr:methyl-accepting chemotaxis protein [Haloarchaeobius amylolyticus]